MKNFKVVGILLLVAAIIASFVIYGIAQDKDKDKKVTAKTETTVKTEKEKVDCPHAKKEDCVKKAADCPHAKTAKVLIKGAKPHADCDKAKADCKENCEENCDHHKTVKKSNDKEK